MKSLCERALCEVERRLSEIARADAYSTDAGLRVLRARRQLAPVEIPAVVVWDNGEQVDAGTGGGAHRSMTMRLAIEVEAHVCADQNSTGEQLERIKADVKRALCEGNGALIDDIGAIGMLAYVGAQAQSRESGAESESVTLQFEASYKEAYGDPSKAR